MTIKEHLDIIESRVWATGQRQLRSKLSDLGKCNTCLPAQTLISKKNPMNAKDKKEFRAYLKNCTDAQVKGVYEKENSAGRNDYAKLAIAEAKQRSIDLH